MSVSGKQSQGVYERIRQIIENARGNIARIVNAEMVLAYWHIGKEIVEEEQRGASRAGYGQKLLETLSMRLTADFGKDLTPVICGICASFIRPFQFSTQCVEN